jgi:hypothetical protein
MLRSTKTATKLQSATHVDIKVHSSGPYPLVSLILNREYLHLSSTDRVSVEKSKSVEAHLP